jgi:hypothetical protein
MSHLEQAVNVLIAYLNVALAAAEGDPSVHAISYVVGDSYVEVTASDGYSYEITIT